MIINSWIENTVRSVRSVYTAVTREAVEEDIYEITSTLQERMKNFRGIRYEFAFGVYLIEDITEPVRLMEDRASVARTSIKNNAIENVAFYDERMQESLENKKFVENNMKSALEAEEFLIYLQPKFSISKEEIVGFEALVRWNHPDRGLISPGLFIPIFEKNGFITRLLNRNKVASDEYYYSVALHELVALGAKQDGEFYMNFQGDRPSNNGSLPMSMLKVYDHFSFRAKLGGFSDCDYTLTVIYKDHSTENTHQKITANGFTVYEGVSFGGERNPQFDNKKWKREYKNKQLSDSKRLPISLIHLLLL